MSRMKRQQGNPSIQSRNSNKLIQSQYFSQTNARPISSKILQKHLTENQHPIFQFIESNFDKLVNFIKPYYAITSDRIVNNVKGLLTSTWQFELPEEQIQQNMQKQQDFIRMSHYLVIPAAQNPRPSSRQSISLQSSMRKSYIQQSDMYNKKYNRSIFMYIWGPITLIILTHLFSNKPFSTSSADILTKSMTRQQATQYINVLAGGAIHILSMSIISFVMFVLFKVINSPSVHSLFQHLTLSSFVGINTIIFSLICSSGISYLIIPFALIYILGCSYLHVNAYNRALKPQVIQLIVMAALLMFFYICTAFMFYNYYVLMEQKVTHSHSKKKHLYMNQNGHYLHQRNYMF